MNGRRKERRKDTKRYVDRMQWIGREGERDRDIERDRKRER